MAINKNFVIKNGVQVDTNLIVGDSTLKKVGIGTTVPQYTLHVHAADRGGIGATDINVVGVATIANLNISGFSTFTNDINVSGMVSAQAFAIGKTEVIDRGFRLSGISSLDAITIATIEELCTRSLGIASGYIFCACYAGLNLSEVASGPDFEK